MLFTLCSCISISIEHSNRTYSYQLHGNACRFLISSSFSYACNIRAFFCPSNVAEMFEVYQFLSAMPLSLSLIRIFARTHEHACMHWDTHTYIKTKIVIIYDWISVRQCNYSLVATTTQALKFFSFHFSPLSWVSFFCDLFFFVVNCCHFGCPILFRSLSLAFLIVAPKCALERSNFNSFIA